VPFWEKGTKKKIKKVWEEAVLDERSLHSEFPEFCQATWQLLKQDGH